MKPKIENPVVWFNAWIKKQLGIVSPSKYYTYGIKYEYDYLIACRDGTIKELEKRLDEEIKKHVGGSQHDENI